MDYSETVTFVNFPAMILCPSLFENTEIPRIVRNVMMDFIKRHDNEHVLFTVIWTLFQAFMPKLPDFDSVCPICIKNYRSYEGAMVSMGKLLRENGSTTFSLGSFTFIPREKLCMCRLCMDRFKRKEFQIQFKLLVEKRKVEKVNRKCYLVDSDNSSSSDD